MASSGNFCTWNPLRVNNQTQTFREGNTRFSSTQTGNNPAVTGTFGVTSGKWYWEIKIVNYGNASNSVGVCRTSAGLEADTGALWNATGDVVFMYLAGGNKRTNGTSTSYGNSWTTGDILQVALDMDNGAVYFGKNNTFQNSGDPTSGSSKTGASFTNLADKGHIQPYSLVYNNGDQVVNFGQDDTFGGRETASGNTDANSRGVFKYAPPSGYLALCSDNLPIPDDIDPAQTDDDYPQKQFNAITWTGNRVYNSTVNNITGVGFQPDLVWLKFREQSYDWRLVDSSRGVTKAIRSNQTTVEQTEANGIYQFDSDGFSVKGDNNYNYNGGAFIGFCWRANGGTTASNTDGSITTTVQANTKAGFSICTYTGNATNGATFGHGLSAKPSFVIIKNRDASQKWAVWHQSADMTDYKLLFLSESSALTTEGTQRWDVSAISSSVFGLGSHPEINGSSADYVAYLWHDVEGFQKFGSYESTGSTTNSPFIYLGFRPRLLAIKNITSSPNNWMVFDTARETFNPIDQNLHWDTGDIEETSTDRQLDILSNGFKLRSENGTLNHPSGNTYIYMAWGDVPFKYNNTF